MRIVVVVTLLLAAGCAADSEVSAVSSADGSSSGSSTESSSPASSEPASTPTTGAQPATSPQSTTTSPVTSATAAETSVETTTEATVETTTKPLTSGSFTSPSGNIACNMHDASGVSCWISERNWEIEQPSGCKDADWGNVIDLGTTGIEWPCYTDFGFDRDAPELPYGSSMVVGSYSCMSERTGVRCSDGREGFNLARAAVTIS